jgi:hypothetical protein
VPELKKANLAWPSNERITSHPFFGNLLKVYSRDGKLKCLSVLPGLGSSNGVRIGPSGKVYIALYAQPIGQKAPEGIAAGEWNKYTWATLVKFNSVYDKYPIGVITDRWDRRQHHRPAGRLRQRGQPREGQPGAGPGDRRVPPAPAG